MCVRVYVRSNRISWERKHWLSKRVRHAEKKKLNRKLTLCRAQRTDRHTDRENTFCFIIVIIIIVIIMFFLLLFSAFFSLFAFVRREIRILTIDFTVRLLLDLPWYDVVAQPIFLRPIGTTSIGCSSGACVSWAVCPCQWQHTESPCLVDNYLSPHDGTRWTSLSTLSHSPYSWNIIIIIKSTAPSKIVQKRLLGVEVIVSYIIHHITIRIVSF